MRKIVGLLFFLFVIFGFHQAVVFGSTVPVCVNQAYCQNGGDTAVLLAGTWQDLNNPNSDVSWVYQVECHNNDGYICTPPSTTPPLSAFTGIIKAYGANGQFIGIPIGLSGLLGNGIGTTIPYSPYYRNIEWDPLHPLQNVYIFVPGINKILNLYFVPENMNYMIGKTAVGYWSQENCTGQAYVMGDPNFLVPTINGTYLSATTPVGGAAYFWSWNVQTSSNNWRSSCTNENVYLDQDYIADDGAGLPPGKTSMYNAVELQTSALPFTMPIPAPLIFSIN